LVLSLEGYFSLIEVAWLSSYEDLTFLLLSYLGENRGVTAELIPVLYLVYVTKE
jgi:hypothetical protein